MVVESLRETVRVGGMTPEEMADAVADANRELVARAAVALADMLLRAGRPVTVSRLLTPLPDSPIVVLDVRMVET